MALQNSMVGLQNISPMLGSDYTMILAFEIATDQVILKFLVEIR